MGLVLHREDRARQEVAGAVVRADDTVNGWHGLLRKTQAAAYTVGTAWGSSRNTCRVQVWWPSGASWDAFSSAVLRAPPSVSAPGGITSQTVCGNARFGCWEPIASPALRAREAFHGSGVKTSPPCHG